MAIVFHYGSNWTATFSSISEITGIPARNLSDQPPAQTATISEPQTDLQGNRQPDHAGADGRADGS